MQYKCTNCKYMTEPIGCIYTGRCDDNYSAYEEDQRIHPTALIGPDVKLGIGNYIGAYARIWGNVTIGDFNKIAPYASIGCPAEHPQVITDFECSDFIGNIQIGDNNEIREFTTIHHPCHEVHETDGLTKIGNNCLLMVHSHYGHEAKLSDNVICSPASMIGGRSVILEHAYIGMGALLHQSTTIGAYAMVGMGAVVTKDILPGLLVAGNPARILGANIRLLEKEGFSREEISDVEYLLNLVSIQPRTKVLLHQWQEARKLNKRREYLRKWKE